MVDLVPTTIEDASARTAGVERTDAIVALRRVTATYQDGTCALCEVTLSVPENRITVLFGPARAGKSTLLRLLNRLTDLTEGFEHEGEVLFRGRDVYGPGIDVSDLRRRISMVFAIPTPLPGSIWANMTYALKMAGLSDRELLLDRVERALRQSALWDEVADRLTDSAFTLSGGQQQRLCLARSLALEPELIVLDNPTSGLDPISTSVVEESLQDLKSRYSIIMVPHSVQQAARLADNACFLLDGELVEEGPGEEVFTTPKDQRTEDYITGRFG